LGFEALKANAVHTQKLRHVDSADTHGVGTRSIADNRRAAIRTRSVVVESVGFRLSQILLLSKKQRRTESG